MANSQPLGHRMTVEPFGARWSLVALCDITFGDRTRFRAILDNSLEGIASNVRASRVAKLTHAEQPVLTALR